MGRRKEREARLTLRTSEQAAEPAPSNKRWQAFVVLVAVITTAYLFQHLQTTFLNLNDARERSVAVRRENLSGRSYREIAELRVPLILTGTVADKWRARETFTTKFLAQKLPFVLAHRQEEERVFITFHDDKPLEALVNEEWEDFNVKINVTLPQVLAWDEDEEEEEEKNSRTGPFLYFSQDVTMLRSDFPGILDYIQPLKELILSPDNVQVNLWIGRTGIVTHTHYDCTFNFFVQLRGRKRFILFPPDSPLYLYPCLHPHYGHSQIDLLEPDNNSIIFSNFSWSGSQVAEMGPGDMLVVPPFWFHHVETLEESVSVNVWSDAPEYALLNLIYEQPVPFEEDWHWDIRVKAAKIYIEMVLYSLSVDKSFIGRQLMSQRYEPVVGSGNLNVSQEAVDETKTLCSKTNWTEETDRLSATFERGINLLQPLFQQFPLRATMEICLGNYIEHLLHLTVGIDYVYPFLQSCF